MDRTEQERGTAEVHTHIGLGPRSDPPASRERHDDTPFGMDDVIFGEGDRDRARGRADELFTRVRDGAASFRSMSVVERVRANPLTAVGIAAVLGFLLAGRSDPDTRFGKAKQRLRGTLIAGLSAALAEEAREILGEEGLAGLASELFGEPGPPPYEDDDDYDYDDDPE